MSTKKALHGAFFFLLLIVFLAGCGSGGGSAPSAGNAPASSTPAGVANLSWAAPTNADGTPLAGVAGFKIHYGTAPGTYSNSISVGMVTKYSITNLAPGTYYFAVTATDSAGNESGFSNEASKTIL